MANNVMEILVTAQDQASDVIEGIGDTADQTASEVSSSAKTMGSSVAEGASRFDTASEGFDRVDTSAMGFRDTLTGVQDTMAGTAEIAKGNLFEGLFLLGAGVGDLASGFVNLLLPSLKGFTGGVKRAAVATKGKVVAMRASAAAAVRQRATTVASTTATVASTAATKASTIATKGMAVAQRLLNAAMRANPIGIVITILAALGAAIVVAWKKSETFRNIVRGAMRGIQAAFGWVLDRGRDVLGWFRALPGNIGGFLSGVADVVTAPFRWAFNGIRDLWNSTVGGKGFTVPDWIPVVGGKSFRIPTLHDGGVFRAPNGQREGLALLRDMERVTTPEQESAMVGLLREIARRIDSRGDRDRRGGPHVENLNVFPERFSLDDLADELARTGAA